MGTLVYEESWRTWRCFSWRRKVSAHAIESSIINDIGIPLGLQAKFRPLFSISGTSEGVLLPALYKVLLSPPTYCSYVFLWPVLSFPEERACTLVSVSPLSQVFPAVQPVFISFSFTARFSPTSLPPVMEPQLPLSLISQQPHPYHVGCF